MRNGKLLAEKPPVDLMREHNANLLEEVVLKLCRKDTDESEIPQNLTIIPKNETDGKSYRGKVDAQQNRNNLPTFPNIQSKKYPTKF